MATVDDLLSAQMQAFQGPHFDLNRFTESLPKWRIVPRNNSSQPRPLSHRSIWQTFLQRHDGDCLRGANWWGFQAFREASSLSEPSTGGCVDISWGRSQGSGRRQRCRSLEVRFKGSQLRGGAITPCGFLLISGECFKTRPFLLRDSWVFDLKGMRTANVRNHKRYSGSWRWSEHSYERDVRDSSTENIFPPNHCPQLPWDGCCQRAVGTARS